MIRYTLKCANGHQFDGWFASGEAFDTQCAKGLVACAICGSNAVTKSLMAPSVQSTRKAEPSQGGESPPAPPALTSPANEVEAAMAKLRAHIEKNSDYVGEDFAREARAMHDGEAPERAIHGEANLEEARALMEDGIGILPLPFRSGRKTN
ncbi:DUF1178 family protein [Thioclava sp. GXIMD4216]|uniref:DUF1178 family protein n=1 Tax=Thioclava litoralis TaxID=3076557 RepID=A0ABZ1E041_9RHOB|nr:DUF1178 family protein [Thioclava sp. FTW29]